MNKYLPIIISLISFCLVSIIFLIILSIVLKVTSKKFNIEKINVYGMFLNMQKKTILSFSLLTLIFLMQGWLLIDLKINYIYVASIISMSIFANLLADDFPYGFINILNTIISIIAISIVAYFNSLITNDTYLFLIIIKWIVIIFLFMYFSYTTLLSLNHLLSVEKNRLVKNKRGNSDENK